VTMAITASTRTSVAVFSPLFVGLTLVPMLAARRSESVASEIPTPAASRLETVPPAGPSPSGRVGRFGVSGVRLARAGAARAAGLLKLLLSPFVWVTQIYRVVSNVRGDAVTRYRRQDKKIDVLVRSVEARDSSVEDVRNLRAEIRRPMVITAIGGIVVAPFLTLVVIPVLYAVLDRKAFRKAAATQGALLSNGAVTP
jgi:hypothetical protein